MDDLVRVQRLTSLAPISWPEDPFHDAVHFQWFQGYGKVRPGELPVFINSNALKEIVSHAESAPTEEVFGVLIGEYCSFEATRFVLVEAIVSSKTARSEAARVWVTAEDWNDLYDERIARYPELRTIGWYHSHPTWGVFLSEADLAIHRSGFKRPFHVAFVCDPQLQTNGCGFFLWHNGEITDRRGFFMYEPTQAFYNSLGCSHRERTRATSGGSGTFNKVDQYQGYSLSSPSPFISGLIERRNLRAGILHERRDPAQASKEPATHDTEDSEEP